MKPIRLAALAAVVLCACARETAPAPAAPAANGGSASPSSPSQARVLATFEGEIDVLAGTLTLRPAQAGPATAGRSPMQVEVPEGGAGGAEVVTLSTDAGTVQTVLHGCGDGVTGDDAFQGDVRITSRFSRVELQNVYAEITDLTPAGREACNAATPPGRAAAGTAISGQGGGLFSYGRIGKQGSADPADSRAVTWKFRLPDATRFTFRGRVVADESYPVSASPRFMAFDGSDLWVSGSAGVTRLATAGGAEVGSYAAGLAPAGVAWDPSTGSAWVADGTSGNVTRIRASDGQADVFAVAATPAGVAYDGASGSVWIAARDPGAVVKLRASDGAFLGGFGSVPNPWAVAVDDAQHTIWVTGEGGTVAEFADDTGIRVHQYLGTPGLRGLAVAGASVWVTNALEDELLQLSAADATLLHSYDVGHDPQAVASDGTRVWVANQGSDTVTELRADTGALVQTYPVAGGPCALQLAGGDLWVASCYAGEVTRISLGGAWSGAPWLAVGFAADRLPVSVPTPLTFVVGGSGQQALTGVGFSVSLPSGLVVASPRNVIGSCGTGTITASAGYGGIQLSGGTLDAGASCSFTVDVVATSPGRKTVTTGTLTASGIPSAPAATATALFQDDAPIFLVSFPGNGPLPVSVTAPLQFRIDNPNAGPLTSVAFSLSLPSGLVVASPRNVVSDCGGTVSASAGYGGISLSGGSLSASTYCDITVDVVATSPGAKTITTGTLSAIEITAPGPTATTSMTFHDDAPTFLVSFPGNGPLPVSVTEPLTFLVQNPNVGPLTSVAFSLSLPSGLLVASPRNVTSTCGGTVSASAGYAGISLSGGSLAAGGSCTITVDVVATTPGTKTITTGTLGATELTPPGPTATTTMTFHDDAPRFDVSFVTPGPLPASLPVSVTEQIAFLITNPNVGPLTNLAFSVSLPSGLLVASPRNVTGTCGGTVSATAGYGGISLAGGTLAMGASCTITLDVVATTPGTKTITTGTLNATELTPPGPTATTTMTFHDDAPTFLVTFSESGPLPVSVTEQLAFLITNPNAGPLTNVAFTSSLPSGLLVASPRNVTSTCGGTVSASAGYAGISLSGGSLAAGASCTILVDVVATSPGTKTITTGTLSATEITAPGPTATTTMTFQDAAPTFLVSFGDLTSIAVGAATPIDFVISNPNTGPLTNVAFGVSLPTGLVVASPTGVINGCGGVVSASAGYAGISLAGGRVEPGASCSIFANVVASSTGTKTITTGALGATELTPPGPTATTSITVTN